MDAATGVSFVPRQVNFIWLSGAQFPVPFHGKTLPAYHSTFHTCGNGSWDPAAATTALDRLHRGGFNWVRVFVVAHYFDNSTAKSRALGWGSN